jgi:hypothetical protein
VSPNYEGGALQVGACDKMPARNQRKEIFRIGFLNISGIRGKGREVEDVIVRENLNILGIGETWLRADDLFSGNILMRKDDMDYQETDSMNRPKRGKRGILALGNKYKDDLNWQKVECNVQEFINIEMEGINIMFVYFPPLKTEEYIYKLKKEIETIKNKIIILGDFNIDVLKSESRQNKFNLLEEVMGSKNLRRVEFKKEHEGTYTLVHKFGASIIDHVWTNIMEVTSEISEVNISTDHELIIAEIKINKSGAKRKYQECIRTVYRPSDKQKQSKQLAKSFNSKVKISYDEMQDDLEVDEMYEILLEKMIENYVYVYKRPQNKTFKDNKQKGKLIMNDKLKFWMAVRQKIKRNVCRTGRYESLIQVKVLIRKEIRRLKHEMWIGHLKDLKDMGYSKIAEQFSRLSKRDVILHNPVKNIEEEVKKIFPYHRKKSGIVLRNFRSRVKTDEKNRKKER